jgi:Tfp pilus assembly protein PilN
MITINLRPGAKRAVQRGAAFAGLGERMRGMATGIREPWQMIAIAAWAIVILGLGFLFISTGARMASLGPQLDEARAEYARYQGFMREKRREERARDSILAQIGTISAVDRDRYIWPHMLADIGDALPDGTWLTEISTIAPAVAPAPGENPPPSVRIVGRTADLGNYTTFLRRLEASPWLINVLPLEANQIVEGNRAMTQFTIQATFSRADSSYIRTTPILESVVEE